MKTILIADDHEIVRNGIKLILKANDPGIQILEAKSCSEVFSLVKDRNLGYAILDMSLEDGNILSMIQTLIQVSPQTNILIYSMNSERLYAKRLLQMGVKSFVSKRADISCLEKAIYNLLRGEMYISPELQNLLFSRNFIKEADNPIETLSDRELEVVEYVAEGMGAKEIAQKLNLDITTVSTYRRRAFEKLKVRNMVELKDKFVLYRDVK